MTIENLATQLKELVILNYQVGDKLPSERELARRLNSTQNRVHRALASLRAEGILQSKAGVGTFFHSKPIAKENFIPPQDNSYSADNSPLFSIQLHLKVKVILGNDISEKMVWEEIFQRFSKEYPYIQIEPIFLEHDTSVPCDVWISNLHATQRLLPELMPMNLQELLEEGFSFDNLSDGCQPLMSIGGELYRLPIMRIPSGMFVNQKLLDKTSVTLRDLESADNIFALAAKMQAESGLLPVAYRGYHWHGCNYGLHIVENKRKIDLDWALLEKLIRDIADYANKDNYTLYKEANTLFAKNELLILHSYFPKQGIDFESGHIANINPCRENGFAPEAITTASVSASSRHCFESQLFAAFLSTPDVQMFLATQNPGWLPINKKVFEELHKTPTAPIDLRPYYSLFSSRIFYDFGPRINVETAKYYLKLQSLEKTISVLKANAKKTRC